MTGFPRSTEWLQIKEDPPGDKRARQTRPGGGLWPATVLTQTGVCRQVDPGTHCSISFRYLSFSSAAFWAISFFLLKHKFTLACWSPCGRSSLFLQLIPDLRKVLNFSSRLPSKDAWTRFGCWGSRSKKIWALDSSVVLSGTAESRLCAARDGRLIAGGHTPCLPANT